MDLKLEIENLQKLHDFFDDRSDADHNGTSYVPNDEMRIAGEIDDLIERLKDYVAGVSPFNTRVTLTSAQLTKMITTKEKREVEGV